MPLRKLCHASLQFLLDLPACHVCFDEDYVAAADDDNDYGSINE